VVIPGLYDPKKPQILIAGFYDILKLIVSKRKPRRIKIFGSDQKSYDFLLKGHEDLRQDERVMQSLSLVNTLLKKNDKTEKKNLDIVTYPVIPLSTDTGLLGWVQNCDTLQQLIKDYRTANHIIKESERNVMNTLCPHYQIVCVPHKLEIFRYIMESTKGDDLKKVLWLKSENAEVWLDKRTNYARSLATMSMVGYILGLGDRHLSNLMMERGSGKIVHIDFGDLFEVTMTREKFPEKVPFRLTRILTKAMEACGIEGNYRFTCNNVMEVLRENKDSLLAILEAFVTDPLLNWRLITTEIITTNVDVHLGAGKQSFKQLNMADLHQGDHDLDTTAGKLEIQFKQNLAENPFTKEADVLNKKALEAVNRIKAKLLGNDFKNHQNLSVIKQVDLLIKQSTSHENICQAWLGWNPFL
jgi:FKBP12-rapamycin complex-associated protein